MRRHHSLHWLLSLALVVAVTFPAQADQPPVLIGIDAEFGVPGSTSAQAIRLGATIAIEEINAGGGVLGGRSLALIEKDNRSVPARSIRNLRELAAQPDLVAALAGRYSPVVVEALPIVHELGLPLLVPWAAADPITAHGLTPNYVFRLSLKDTWALQALLTHAERQGMTRVGLLLSNTEWGRSSQHAAEAFARARPALRIVGTEWFNWGDTSLMARYQSLRQAGAEALVFVTNEREGAILINELAALEPEQRLPILAHWGITGGTFFELVGPALAQMDLVVVQTYSFLDPSGAVAERVLAAIARHGIANAREILSPVGVAHAYDLVQILARAIALAGSTERAAVRDALEQVTDYPGLIKDYPRPFTPEHHDALAAEDVFVARYAADGAIERISEPRP